MYGAIIGDIVGSRFEWLNIKSKEFDFFSPLCSITDDSVLSIALAKAFLLCKGEYDVLPDYVIDCMREFGHKYPNAGYGSGFLTWLDNDNPEPYNSWGNGAAMRVSSCGLIARSIREVKRLSRKVTEVTHNHPEGLKGAEATAVAVYMAKKGKNKKQIGRYINKHYYKLDFTLDKIRDSYYYDVSCQGSVPQAIQAFLESKDYEDAIRNAISIGGDSDTIAAITGGIAGAYYGIPRDIIERAKTYVPEEMQQIIEDFQKFCSYRPKRV